MKDYFAQYKVAHKATPKYAEGGAAPAPQGAAPQAPPAGPQDGAPAEDPAMAAPQGPEAELQMMVEDYATSGDPQVAVAIADMLVTMMSGGGAQGGDPAAQGMDPAAQGGDPSMGGQPGGGAPAPAFKKGGKMGKMCACGKMPAGKCNCGGKMAQGGTTPMRAKDKMLASKKR